jgi:hypothetical protein
MLRTIKITAMTNKTSAISIIFFQVVSDKPRLSIGVRSFRAEPFGVLRTGFVEAFSYCKNPFDRLRANGLINLDCPLALNPFGLSPST